MAVQRGRISSVLSARGHRGAGGDVRVSPFGGEDDEGMGAPPVPGPFSGGFEFLFANPVGDVFQVGATCVQLGENPPNPNVNAGVWNGFFLNSNGNITFGGGDKSNNPTVPTFRSGLPRIAAAWTDLNPGSRGQVSGTPAAGFSNTCPVQALGFAGVKEFRIRWINVPEFGNEFCDSRNTMSIDLFDDGTGIDETASQLLNPVNPIGNNAVAFDQLEGSTALRFNKRPRSGMVVGCVPRQGRRGQLSA